MLEKICDLINYFLQSLPGDWAMYIMLSFWAIICAIPVILIGLVIYFVYKYYKNKGENNDGNEKN